MQTSWRKIPSATQALDELTCPAVGSCLSRIPKGHSGHPKGLGPYFFFLLTNRRNLAGDFQRFPSEVTPSLAYDRSNSCAITSPTAFNLCPTKGATDADNRVHQNEQRDLMARASP